jgi:hypothetical protein
VPARTAYQSSKPYCTSSVVSYTYVCKGTQQSRSDKARPIVLQSLPISNSMRRSKKLVLFKCMRLKNDRQRPYTFHKHNRASRMRVEPRS